MTDTANANAARATLATYAAARAVVAANAATTKEYDND